MESLSNMDVDHSEDESPKKSKKRKVDDMEVCHNVPVPDDQC